MYGEYGGDFGAQGGGGYNPNFVDYLNQLYGSDMGGAAEAWGAGGGTTMGGGLPSAGSGMGKMGGGSKMQQTTPFGQFQTLSQRMQPGSQARMIGSPNGMRPRSSDMDYAKFLQFMATIGPLLFGGQLK